MLSKVLLKLEEEVENLVENNSLFITSCKTKDIV
jgi:hypothetical protein